MIAIEPRSHGYDARTMNAPPRPLPVASLSLLALVLTSCEPRTYALFDSTMPNSPDFRELPRGNPINNDPLVLRLHSVVCPDHGRVTGWTGDLAAAKHARFVHNDRYHDGGGRAQVATELLVGDRSGTPPPASMPTPPPSPEEQSAAIDRAIRGAAPTVRGEGHEFHSRSFASIRG
jgi:hypothetical protein